jgi:predicted phage tail component-like protein
MNGFTFDGKHSSDYSIIVTKKNVPITPPIEDRLQTISGFDGAWDYGISYSPRPIEIECTMLADSKEDLKTKIRNFAALLNPRKGAKSLIFDDDPNVQYFARLNNQIPLEQLGAMGTFTLQFICPDPFTYSKNPQVREGVTTIFATHNGTHIARPTLTVTHGGWAASISVDSTGERIDFTDDSPSGTYVIDCKEMTITLDGAAGYNYVKGDFFGFVNGSNVVRTTGGITNVQISYYDTWL